MKVLGRIFGVLVGLIIILAIVGLFLPREISVTRSIEIDAPPTTVFALVNGFRHFNRFSPWADLDPNAEYTYTGPEEGVGAAMRWTSDEIGSGSQEVIESVPYSKVKTALVFDGSGGGTATFHLQPVETGDASGTAVEWVFDMDAGYNLVNRYFGLVMDDMLGENYELGLQNLKEIAESYPQLDITGFEPQRIEIAETQLVSMRKRTTMDPEEMLASMASAYLALDTYLQLNEIEPIGMPRIITHEWNEEESLWTFDAVYPIPPDSFVERGVNGIDRGRSYSGPALEVVLEGADWETSVLTYEKVALYMQLQGYEEAGDSWEAYESDPITTPPEELVTHIVFPVSRVPLQ
jgi:effector-binding domain-containing protein/carbon monoxide dehydrogenase subunit G